MSDTSEAPKTSGGVSKSVQATFGKVTLNIPVMTFSTLARLWDDIAICIAPPPPDPDMRHHIAIASAGLRVISDAAGLRAGEAKAFQDSVSFADSWKVMPTVTELLLAAGVLTPVGNTEPAGKNANADAETTATESAQTSTTS